MWKAAVMQGIGVATLLMSLILIVGFVGSVVVEISIFRYAVEIIAFSLTGVLLLVGGCMFSRLPLQDSKRYDDEGNPNTSWRMALLGFRLMVASVFLFLYGFLFTLLSIFIGI